MRGAEAPEGKEAELPAGREAVEELSRHRAKSNLNFHHLTPNSQKMFTQIVLQNIGVEGFSCNQSVIRTVGLHNVGCPCEQVKLKGVQAEMVHSSIAYSRFSAPKGCSAWTQPSLQERIHTGSTFHLCYTKVINRSEILKK